MNEDLPDYVIEPCENLKEFGPRVVRSAGTTPYMCVVNTSDRYLTLKKGQEIGRAYPVVAYVSDSDQTVSDADYTRVQQVRDDTDDNTLWLPEHLRETFERSKGLLSENQQIGLAQLLGSFEDVFAKNEFDLGTFTEIEHTIDTGGARPIKQRLRCTPACFVGEEETHLKKMLDAGVIQESTSEWASSPVLIIKSGTAVCDGALTIVH